MRHFSSFSNPVGGARTGLAVNWPQDCADNCFEQVTDSGLKSRSEYPADPATAATVTAVMAATLAPTTAVTHVAAVDPVVWAAGEAVLVAVVAIATPQHALSLL